MQNFLDACKSRNPKDLHDPIDNAHYSASLCHLANISYRTGRKLHIEAGPKFANDAEANKILGDAFKARGIDLPLGHQDDPPDAHTCWGLGHRKSASFQEGLAAGAVEVFPDAPG